MNELMKASEVKLPSGKAIRMQSNALILPEDLTQDEWIDVGKMLGTYDGGLSWWYGDWYNALESEHGEKENVFKERLKDQVTWTHAVHCAEVSKEFDICERSQKLTFHHHAQAMKAKDGKRLDKATMIKLLERAERFNPNEKKDPPASATWVGKWRDELLGIAQVKKTFEDATGDFNAMLADVPKKYKAQVKKVVNKVKSNLAEAFDEQLAESVAKQTSAQRVELDEKRDLYESKSAGIDQMRESYKMLLDRDEYKLIRNCLHPDRAPEDRKEKFTRAFQIFTRLEEEYRRV